ncbi:MAG: RluA family pseudouridine synthase [Oscillospiraceae bacterium]|nr:RluA family pseudouridine synthase [Oscillospiraceae bacterium]
MSVLKLTVLPEDSGARADSFISARYPQLSRSAAARLLTEGQVAVGGCAIGKNHRVSPGETLELTLPDIKDTELTAQDIPLDVVFEDEHLIVINKPRGLVVHPAPGHEEGTLVNALMHHCGDSLSGINGERRPGIVHRIDKDTSGLLVCAKNDAAHRSLAEQIKQHKAGRIYETVVCGNMKEESGRIDAPIGRNPSDRKKMAVTHKNSREAATNWRVLERFNGYTHLECRLETGRTHQIRVHLASIGKPVLGDTVYGRKKPEMGQSCQCLHARQLQFEHPATGELITLTAPLPDYFQEVLNKLRRL